MPQGSGGRAVKRQYVLLVLAAALIAIPGAARGYRLDESWRKSFPVKEGAEFVLTNASGSILIDGWDESRIDVTAEIHIKSPSKSKSRQLFEGIRFADESDGSRVAIEAQLPKIRQDVFFGSRTGQHTSIKILYRVKVPRHTPLKIRTVEGDIMVKTVAGTFELHTDRGLIVAWFLDGDGTIETGDGSVDVGFKQFPATGKLSIRAAGRPLYLSIPGSTGADIDAEAVNGGVHVDIPAGHLAEMKRGHWTGRLNGGGATIRLHTVSGEIYIRQSVP